MLDTVDDAEILKRAKQHMMASRFAEALDDLTPLLAREPAEAEALYMAAVCARYLHAYGDARRHLDALKAQAPELGRAHQEEGHLLRQLGEQAEALKAYAKACQYNPALHASWAAQADLAEALGFDQAAAHARQQLAHIKSLPQDLVTVTHLIHEGKLLKAEKLCRHFLQNRPHHVEGMRLLADIGARFGALNEADFLLESAVAFDPNHVGARLDYIQVLRKRQKFEAAVEQAKELYERDPDNPVFQSHYAIESLQTGEFDRALKLFESILQKLPHDPATLTSRGHALKTYGRQDEAVESYRAAFKAKPDHGDAYYGLANLKTYRFSDDEMTAMSQQAARPDIAHNDKIQLSFALGKAHEDRKNFDTAFDFYAQGNALKRIQTRYNPDHMEEELRAQAEICTKDLFDTRLGEGHPSPDPIFIVGLPRAGSTLLEQILASHSQVDGTLELPNVLTLSHMLRGRKRITSESRYPRILHDLASEKLKEMGESYITDTMIHRQGAPFFIDKMPNNFRHIGLILLMLPNAKIIDARREPMDCCVSGFKQLFAEGQEFTYSLEDIGRYYRNYVDLMDHWHRVVPGRILHVQHEDVVHDLEGQVTRMLEFVGLPFEQACLDFHETERAVRTASSEQVRQPINPKSIGQWRRFENHLEPLQQALGPALTDYRR